MRRTELRRGLERPPEEPGRRGMIQTILLGCGIAASLLYVVTDLLGGMAYEGYSFSAQTISELGAIGSPSKSFVDPLFLTYDVLLVAFGIGVMRESVARKRALHFAALLLAGIGVIGLVSFGACQNSTAGSPSSPVHRAGSARQRPVGSLSSVPTWW